MQRGGSVQHRPPGNAVTSASIGQAGADIVVDSGETGVGLGFNCVVAGTVVAAQQQPSVDQHSLRLTTHLHGFLALQAVMALCPLSTVIGGTRCGSGGAELGGAETVPVRRNRRRSRLPGWFVRACAAVSGRCMRFVTRSCTLTVCVFQMAALNVQQYPEGTPLHDIGPRSGVCRSARLGAQAAGGAS
jgi:hypothetical protein